MNYSLDEYIYPNAYSWDHESDSPSSLSDSPFSSPDMFDHSLDVFSSPYLCDESPLTASPRDISIFDAPYLPPSPIDNSFSAPLAKLPLETDSVSQLSDDISNSLALQHPSFSPIPCEVYPHSPTISTSSSEGDDDDADYEVEEESDTDDDDDEYIPSSSTRPRRRCAQASSSSKAKASTKASGKGKAPTRGSKRNISPTPSWSSGSSSRTPPPSLANRKDRRNAISPYSVPVYKATARRHKQFDNETVGKIQIASGDTRCELCHYVYRRSQDLKRHMGCHADLKIQCIGRLDVPYGKKSKLPGGVVEGCGRWMSRPDALRRHLTNLGHEHRIYRY